MTSAADSIAQHGSAQRALGVLLLLLLASCPARDRHASLPDQRQPAEREKQIAALDIQRAGRLRVEIHSLDPAAADDATSESVTFLLQSPATEVEDTEIRGSLDGSTKYSFNQGTAYHMRVGRRFSGEHHGELELKRSLIRWHLRELPAPLEVKDVEVSVWVEGFSVDSPLAQDDPPLPLHVYAYALDDEWGPGHGGVERNSFSNAAPGEASWNEARAGERAWPAPGALAPDARPLATAIIDGDNRWLRLRSDALREFVERCARERRSVDLLLKLGDDEEDRWGTETAFFTSDFGDERDLVSRRPRLALEARVGTGVELLDEAFVLELGEQRRFEVALPGDGPALLTARVLPDPGVGVMQPMVLVREAAREGHDADEGWIELRAPLQVDWKRAEVRLSTAPNLLELGEEFRLTLNEPWVSPGPREQQLPELILVAPSRRVHRVDGRILDETHYEIDFTPSEPGLWRYGWSYLPRWQSPPGSHQGEGLFYVLAPLADRERLQAWAEEITEDFEGHDAAGPSLEYRFDALVREAARYGGAGAEQHEQAEQILERARAKLPAKFRPDEE